MIHSKKSEKEMIFLSFKCDISYDIEVICPILYFIIHPCDPTVVICYLIWPCDIAVRITYLILSHSYSLSYTVSKGYFRLGV